MPLLPARHAQLSRLLVDVDISTDGNFGAKSIASVALPCLLFAKRRHCILWNTYCRMASALVGNGSHDNCGHVVTWLKYDFMIILDESKVAPSIVRDVLARMHKEHD